MSLAGDLMTSGGFPNVHNSANATMEDAAGRRMSDPVRPLDRNYGVNGSLSRHRSYSNLGGAPARQPLHGAVVRGQEGMMGAHQYQQVRFKADFLFFVSVFNEINLLIVAYMQQSRV